MLSPLKAFLYFESLNIPLAAQWAAILFSADYVARCKFNPLPCRAERYRLRHFAHQRGSATKTATKRERSIQSTKSG
jgi:hypothetical protein